MHGWWYWWVFDYEIVVGGVGESGMCITEFD